MCVINDVPVELRAVKVVVLIVEVVVFCAVLVELWVVVFLLAVQLVQCWFL